MFRSKKPKRIKVWVNEYGSNVGFAHPSRRDARAALTPSSTRVAVRLVELRRGEVVVDVEALVEGFEERAHEAPYSSSVHNLRAALKKVGVR